MVAALHQMGKEVIMLTGDNDQTAQAIAQKGWHQTRYQSSASAREV